jgi:hypothetical protein
MISNQERNWELLESKSVDTSEIGETSQWTETHQDQVGIQKEE